MYHSSTTHPTLLSQPPLLPEHLYIALRSIILVPIVALAPQHLNTDLSTTIPATMSFFTTLFTTSQSAQGSAPVNCNDNKGGSTKSTSTIKSAAQSHGSVFF